MSVLPVGFGGGSSGIDTGDIANSLRFRSAASAYLSRTFGTPTNNQKFIYSDWIKRGSLGSDQFILQAGDSINQEAQWYFQSDDTIRFYQYTGSYQYDYYTVAKFRDPSAFFHLFVLYDSTQATAANRFRVWINGVEQTLTRTVEVALNSTNSKVNSAVSHDIGGSNIQTRWSDCYRARTCLVDGTAAVTSFGYLNTEINEWVSKTASEINTAVVAGGGWGNNGDLWDFDDATSLTTLGYGKYNSNNWTLNNHSLTAGVTYDHMLDVPGNSYAVLNPLNYYSAGTTLSYANLRYTDTGGGGAAAASMAFDIATATVEWSVYIESASFGAVGIAPASANFQASTVPSGVRWYYGNNGNKYIDTSNTAYGATFTTGDTIKVRIDNGSVTFYKNGSSQGVAWSGLTGAWVPMLRSGAGCTMVIDFGQNGFTPATGYTTLCQANLPDPAILNPKEHFDVTTWAGNSSYPRTISGLQFQPDLVWPKCRNSAQYHVLQDVVRGFSATTVLQSNTTSAENSDAQTQGFYGYVSGATTDGFTVNKTGPNGENVNYNTFTYAAWLWKAGGAGVTNTAGSITSTVSANVEAGFSIVTYTGTGANATVGHGLGVAPKMVIVKNKSASGNWNTYHASLGATEGIYLDSTGAKVTSINFWNNTAPTSSVFSVSSGGQTGDTNSKVAYCFADSPISKFGSYVGNSSTDGVYVHCGFRPAFVMLKETTLGTEHWFIFDSERDTYNRVDHRLMPNLPNAEDQVIPFADFTSQGFKLRPSSSYYNQVCASGVTYIFAAFADVAGKYALAR